MADCYVASIRRGDVPCVESVLRTTAERENVRAVEHSVAVYERLMTEQLDASPADSVQAFIAAHERSEHEATTTFNGLVMFDTDSTSRQQLDVRYSPALSSSSGPSCPTGPGSPSFRAPPNSPCVIFSFGFHPDWNLTVHCRIRWYKGLRRPFLRPLMWNRSARRAHGPKHVKTALIIIIIIFITSRSCICRPGVSRCGTL